MNNGTFNGWDKLKSVLCNICRQDVEEIAQIFILFEVLQQEQLF